MGFGWGMGYVLSKIPVHRVGGPINLWHVKGYGLPKVWVTRVLTVPTIPCDPIQSPFTAVVGLVVKIWVRLFEFWLRQKKVIKMSPEFPYTNINKFTWYFDNFFCVGQNSSNQGYQRQIPRLLALKARGVGSLSILGRIVVQLVPSSVNPSLRLSTIPSHLHIDQYIYPSWPVSAAWD
jgi:hypothetical protein